jgi:hypothetical protein
MVNDYYRIADLKYIAAGAAILASGGGGSYLNAVNIIKEFEATGWSGAIPLQFRNREKHRQYGERH